jgi:hypothetical protein
MNPILMATSLSSVAVRRILARERVAEERGDSPRVAHPTTRLTRRRPKTVDGPLVLMAGAP